MHDINKIPKFSQQNLDHTNRSPLCIYVPNINRVRTSIEIYICKSLHLHELWNMRVRLKNHTTNDVPVMFNKSYYTIMIYDVYYYSTQSFLDSVIRYRRTRSSSIASWKFQLIFRLIIVMCPPTSSIDSLEYTDGAMRWRRTVNTSIQGL